MLRTALAVSNAEPWSRAYVRLFVDITSIHSPSNDSSNFLPNVSRLGLPNFRCLLSQKCVPHASQQIASHRLSFVLHATSPQRLHISDRVSSTNPQSRPGRRNQTSRWAELPHLSVSAIFVGVPALLAQRCPPLWAIWTLTSVRDLCCHSHQPIHPLTSPRIVIRP